MSSDPQTCPPPARALDHADDSLRSAVADRVVVAMSGGVDSSVAAALVAQHGYEAVGIAMRLYSTPQQDYSRSCCSPDDLFDARTVADTLGIPFYVANYEKEFQSTVIDYFVGEYERGRTPNPCVACNNHLKFDVLLKRSLALGSSYLATGHYARIDRTGEVPVLRTGLDAQKDQSYFLYGLPREALPRIMFPVGELTKDEVRDAARGLNLETAEKPESQEICFVTGKSYREFVEDRLAREQQRPGNFVLEDGHVIGKHDGIHRFTIGQRRGIGIAWDEPLFVKAIRPATSEVVLGPKGSLLARGFHADRCNWLSFERPSEPIECEAKIRYRSRPVAALVTAGDDPSTVTVEFAEPQRAVTPGQAAVFYRGDEVLGGATIEEART